MKRLRLMLAAAVVLAAAGVHAVDDTLDDSKLAAALTQEREKRIADLYEYAEKGVFPHNHGHPDQRIPYFMDRHGRLCAVGFLIAKSVTGNEWSYERFMGMKQVATSYQSMSVRMPGDDERMKKSREAKERLTKALGFFNDIAKANVNVRVMDIKDGPVHDWILKSGLTQEEAALIQPGYSYLACDACIAGSEAKKVGFGKPTEEAKNVEDEDRRRIRVHLQKVIMKLRVETPKSVKTASARLKARGPVHPWKLERSPL